MCRALRWLPERAWHLTACACSARLSRGGRSAHGGAWSGVDRSAARNVAALAHAPLCALDSSDCGVQGCDEMKHLFRHCARCTTRLGGGCKMCKL